MQDCIDFCHKHNIVPKIKVVTANDLGEVYKELASKNDSIIRYNINEKIMVQMKFQECPRHRSE